MFARTAVLLAALNLAPTALAQVADKQYTVWSSVVFTRTGERTPEVLGYIPTTLTSVGADQAVSAGLFFRNRYILSQYRNVTGGTSGLVEQGGPIHGLATNFYSPIQLFATSLEQQYNLATAQAFLQGLYPPVSPNTTVGDTFLDPTSILANGTYVSRYKA